MEDQNLVDDFLNKYKYPLLAGLVGLVLLLGGLFSSGIISKTFIKQSKYPASAVPASTNAGFVKVDVSGAVFSPGVYSLPSGSRIEEAIKAAGGVTETADPVYVSKSLNLAQKTTDGMKIYIPAAAESGSSGSTAVLGANSAEQSLININEASLNDLDKLPGVGPVTAQNIIDKRPYGTIEELLSKKAVTRSVYEKIKDSVSVY